MRREEKMTNHELILEEREKAKNNLKDVKAEKRKRRKERKQEVVWLEGSKKTITRPEYTIYYPFHGKPVVDEQGNTTTKIVPEIKEFVSRKDQRRK
jgi:hypothetical protein